MRKYLLSFLICLIAIPLMFSGCGFTPLKNAPSVTAEMNINGCALRYENYLYFANSFVSYSSTGSAKENSAIYRVALNNTNETSFFDVDKDEDTKLPSGLEKVNSKIVASENTIMFSIGEYIYFASPSVNLDANDSSRHLYEYNQYFRIKTDGTGLTKSFYDSQSTISSQTFMTIGIKTYLILVDTRNITENNEEKTVNVLVRIDLSNFDSEILVQDFTSVIFAKDYKTSGDEMAYFLRDANPDNNQIGSELYKVNISTGEVSGVLNANQTRTMSLLKVYNGKLFLKITGQVGVGTELAHPAYFSLANTNIYDPQEILGTVPSDLITAFDVLVENDVEYYVFSVSTADTVHTYVLTSSSKQLAGNEWLDNQITILFCANGYVYYTIEGQDGIFRKAVTDSYTISQQSVMTMSDFKTTNISFDGTYIYYYATNSELTTGSTYYLHRSQVETTHPSSELLSFVPADEILEDEEE